MILIAGNRSTEKALGVFTRKHAPCASIRKMIYVLAILSGERSDFYAHVVCGPRGVVIMFT